MLLNAVAPLGENPEPLHLADLPTPVPGEHEILIRVTVCGVCHTELDEIEGRTPPPRLPVVPGHEVVGRVASLGPDREGLVTGIPGASGARRVGREPRRGGARSRHWLGRRR